VTYGKRLAIMDPAQSTVHHLHCEHHDYSRQLGLSPIPAHPRAWRDARNDRVGRTEADRVGDPTGSLSGQVK
jgi:hypothetical protein